MTITEDFEGEELDVAPYEGDPNFNGPVVDEGDLQDDEPSDHPMLGLLARMPTATRTWVQALDWYKNHQTKSQIGFDPDGMCLKVCRTARNIPAKHLTAREAMLATPAEHRVHKVRDLRRGMVAFYADPRDENPADHIVTIIGRVKDFDPESLHDVLVETNSVKSDELVIVRGDYFEQYWGDDFKFGATSLNGVELDTPHYENKVERFHDSAPKYNLALLKKAGDAGRLAAFRTLDKILTQVNQLPDSPKLVRVREFKDQVRSDRILDIRLLDEAVKAGRTGRVKEVRDEIRRLIDALPDD